MGEVYAGAGARADAAPGAGRSGDPGRGAVGARELMWSWAFIAREAPFIGLFGTVYGIVDAFIRIGTAKTASLPVVAPAIGEALITTAIGLAAAIPAVFFYNWIDKQIGDFVVELEAATEWVALMAEHAPAADGAIPLRCQRSPQQLVAVAGEARDGALDGQSRRRRFPQSTSRRSST